MLPEVEVYSMRKGSWELITQRLPLHITIIPHDDDKVCTDGHDGHLHWLCYTHLQNKPQMIAAFDLGEEAFREIPLPHSTLDYWNKLGVLGGKLCVVSRRFPDGEWEVWVMDEYGVVDSWVKHYAFPQLGGDITPYGFTSDSKFIFQVDRDHFDLYDPVAANAKSFQMPSLFGVDKIVEFVDSLVWVAPAEHGGIS